MSQIILLDGGCLVHAVLRAIGPDTPERDIKGLIELEEYRHKNAAPIGALTIVAGDYPPYWRSSFYPAYKKNRREKTPQEQRVVELFYASKVLPKIRFPSYEADDVATAIVSLFHTRTTDRFTSLQLWTPDTDWMALISPGVTWHGMGNNKVRFMDENTFPEYFERIYLNSKASRSRKEEWPLPENPEPRHSADFKIRVAGDPADNINVTKMTLNERIETLTPIVDLHNPGVTLPQQAVGQAIAAILQEVETSSKLMRV